MCFHHPKWYRIFSINLYHEELWRCVRCFLTLNIYISYIYGSMFILYTYVLIIYIYTSTLQSKYTWANGNPPFSKQGNTSTFHQREVMGWNLFASVSQQVYRRRRKYVRVCSRFFVTVRWHCEHIYHMSVGTGGSPKNSIVWWSKCNKTPLFTVFSAHTQIASMLMLREHMSCLFATIRRFFMTCVDTFSSQHIETA